MINSFTAWTPIRSKLHTRLDYEIAVAQTTQITADINEEISNIKLKHVKLEQPTYQAIKSDQKPKALMNIDKLYSNKPPEIVEGGHCCCIIA